MFGVVFDRRVQILRDASSARESRGRAIPAGSRERAVKPFSHFGRVYIASFALDDRGFKDFEGFENAHSSRISMSPSAKQSAQLGLDVQGEVHVGKSLETGNVSSYSGPVGVSHVSHKETQATDSQRRRPG